MRSPGRNVKRPEATAKYFSRAKHRKMDVPLDQSNRKAIEALTAQVKFGEEFTKEIGKILDHFVNNYKELKSEQVRGNKWHADSTSRILGVENRVNEKFKDAKTYINEKFKEANTQAAAHTFEKMQVHEGRLAALDAAIQEQRDNLERHQSYLQKMHAAKPEEEKTIFTLFKTLRAEIVKLNAGVKNMPSLGNFSCMSSAFAQSLHKFILDSSERQRCCCDANNALREIACYQSRVQLLGDIV